MQSTKEAILQRNSPFSQYFSENETAANNIIMRHLSSNSSNFPKNPGRMEDHTDLKKEKKRSR